MSSATFGRGRLLAESQPRDMTELAREVPPGTWRGQPTRRLVAFAFVADLDRLLARFRTRASHRQPLLSIIHCCPLWTTGWFQATILSRLSLSTWRASCRRAGESPRQLREVGGVQTSMPSCASVGPVRTLPRFS